MNLFIENLSAVRASPNRSYTTLNRGARSFQCGGAASSGAARAPMNRPAGRSPVRKVLMTDSK